MFSLPVGISGFGTQLIKLELLHYFNEGFLFPLARIKKKRRIQRKKKFSLFLNIESEGNELKIIKTCRKSCRTEPTVLSAATLLYQQGNWMHNSVQRK